MRGVRIQARVRELGGEKIDVVQWDPDPRVFIANALSPAKVLSVALDEDVERRTATVIVPDGQLSLAIGREGQNARLGAKLTGWRIDIRAEAEAAELLEAIRAEEAAEAIGAAPPAIERPAVPPPTTEVFEPEDLPALEPAAILEPVTSTVPEAPSGEPSRERQPTWRIDDEEDEDDDASVESPAAKKRKGRQLVRDPKTGKVVTQIHRKKSRGRGEWLDDETWQEVAPTELEMADFDLFGEPEEFGFEDEEEEEEAEE
jgi:N utilization substance protein A